MSFPRRGARPRGALRGVYFRPFSVSAQNNPIDGLRGVAGEESKWFRLRRLAIAARTNGGNPGDADVIWRASRQGTHGLACFRC